MRAFIPQPNDPPPTKEERLAMTRLRPWEPIAKGDWIEDIQEWADSGNGLAGVEFHEVYSFQAPAT